jgi:hypothetical protein
VDRRALLSAAAVGSTFIVPKAWALIPDEEDEELLERAKANRQKRIASQKETTRAFLQEEGVTNRTLNAELVPVQKAVFQLAKSGVCNRIGSGKLRNGRMSTQSHEDLLRVGLLDSGQGMFLSDPLLKE